MFLMSCIQTYWFNILNKGTKVVINYLRETIKGSYDFWQDGIPVFYVNYVNWVN